ncbi:MULTISPECIES: PTS lactose/cellobiose transporter subunit IIA [Vagococcus]|uniref:PTS lactose/cellobiose transporter subunit IIA n=1 Tax=Vagococcus TaxID=2737 RepID=UPI002FCBF11F
MSTEQISFELISKAGDAFGYLVQAIQFASEGQFEEADKKISESETVMNDAHKVQTSMIVKEAQGEDNDISVLLIHAQDTLMNTILMATLTKEFVKVYKKLREEEK